MQDEVLVKTLKAGKKCILTLTFLDHLFKKIVWNPGGLNPEDTENDD